VVTAIIVRPDLIITDVMMSEINGWEFKKLLNKIPNMIEIPFIFLTSTETLPVEYYSQDFGMSDYMPKPYAFDDLLAKVEKNLRRHEQRQKTLSPEVSSPSGILQDMSLTDILQVLSMNKRSCKVKLVRGEQTGEIYFRQGRVSGACMGSQEGEEALFELLGWKGAKFSVGEISNNDEETISKDIHSLIAEGMKRSNDRKNPPSTHSAPTSGDEPTMEISPNGQGKEIIHFLHHLQKKGLLKEITG
jgi:CheY-like chemotaxis protein